MVTTPCCIIIMAYILKPADRVFSSDTTACFNIVDVDISTQSIYLMIPVGYESYIPQIEVVINGDINNLLLFHAICVLNNKSKIILSDDLDYYLIEVYINPKQSCIPHFRLPDDVNADSIRNTRLLIKPRIHDIRPIKLRSLSNMFICREYITMMLNNRSRYLIMVRPQTEPEPIINVLYDNDDDDDNDDVDDNLVIDLNMTEKYSISLPESVYTIYVIKLQLYENNCVSIRKYLNSKPFDKISLTEIIHCLINYDGYISNICIVNNN